MTIETTELKTFGHLKEILISTKADMNKAFNESARGYAKIMAMKELGLYEINEEIEVAIIGSIVSGTLCAKMIEALDEEIEALSELINYKAESEEKEVPAKESTKEITEEEIKKAVEMITEIFGIEK